MSLQVKEAIRRAFDYAHEYEEFLSPQHGLKDLRLEEVDYNDASGVWRVTLGFDTGKKRRRTSGAPMFPETTYEDEREFRTFVIANDTGDIQKIERG